MNSTPVGTVDLLQHRHLDPHAYYLSCSYNAKHSLHLHTVYKVYAISCPLQCIHISVPSINPFTASDIPCKASANACTPRSAHVVSPETLLHMYSSQQQLLDLISAHCNQGTPFSTETGLASRRGYSAKLAFPEKVESDCPGLVRGGKGTAVRHGHQ